MPTETLSARLEHTRILLNQDHDPREMHDRLVGLADEFNRRDLAVPTDIREAMGELEAEIFETFYDNLPV